MHELNSNIFVANLITFAFPMELRMYWIEMVYAKVYKSSVSIQKDI